MSIITKESVIKATLNDDNIGDILEEYCKEKEVPEEYIGKLITAIMSNPILFQECYLTALEYFQIKYNITLVHSNNKLITAY